MHVYFQSKMLPRIPSLGKKKLPWYNTALYSPTIYSLARVGRSP